MRAPAFVRSCSALCCVLFAAADLAAQDQARTEVLRGTVRDPEGNPVAGALVQLLRDESDGFNCLDLVYAAERPVVGEIRTAKNGTFAFLAASGLPHDLVVDMPPFAIERRLGVYAGEQVDFDLQPAATLKIEVVRAPDESAVVGALVKVRGMGWTTLHQGVTDQAGKITIARMAPMDVGVHVSNPVEALPGGTGVTLVGGETAVARILLQRGTIVRGTITDAVTGKPIQGAEVAHGWVFEQKAVSDADGVYALQDLGPARGNEIHVRAAGYESQLIPHPEPTDAEITLDWRLVPGLTASGRILAADGEPLPGAYVAVIGMKWLDGRQTTDWLGARTDAEGRYSVRGLRAALPHYVYVRHDAHGTGVQPTPDPVAGHVDAGTIRLQPRRILQGTIVGADGKPEPGRKAFLRGANTSSGLPRAVGTDAILSSYLAIRESTSDSLGRFFFGDLAAGTYTLVIGQGQDAETHGEIVVTEDEDPPPVRIER